MCKCTEHDAHISLVAELAFDQILRHDFVVLFVPLRACTLPLVVNTCHFKQNCWTCD